MLILRNYSITLVVQFFYDSTNVYKIMRFKTFPHLALIYTEAFYDYLSLYDLSHTLKKVFAMNLSYFLLVVVIFL